MARTISASFRRALEASASEHFPLAFVTISHASFATPLRYVCDVADYVWAGNTYTAALFDIQILSDDDRPPESRVVIPNISPMIGDTILALTSPPRVQIDICNSQDFNLTVTPRVAVTPPGPTAEYSASSLWLVDVEVDAIQISGRITSWIYNQEQWPSVRATQDRAPGVFR